MVYPALLPLMRTPRLSVVELTPPADLNGLVRFAERRNLVSARVPSHFNWLLPQDGGLQECIELTREECVVLHDNVAILTRAHANYLHVAESVKCQQLLG